jgi:hypothetical protein
MDKCIWGFLGTCPGIVVPIPHIFIESSIWSRLSGMDIHPLADQPGPSGRRKVKEVLHAKSVPAESKNADQLHAGK